MTTILFEEGSPLKENANEYDWQSKKTDPDIDL